jgi:hypothetical protein
MSLPSLFRPAAPAAPLFQAVYRVGTPEHFAFFASPYQTLSLVAAEGESHAFDFLGFGGFVLPGGAPLPKTFTPVGAVS